MQDCFKENGSEEVDNDQSGIESDPQETVEEIVKEVIPYDFSKTHIDVELITQEIEEWQAARGAKIAALVGNETWEMVLCSNGVSTIGCM